MRSGNTIPQRDEADTTLPPGSSARRGNEDLDLRDLISSLWRHKLLIFCTIFVGCVLAWWVISLLTPLYTASSSVMIEARDNQITDMKEVVPQLDATEETVNSQIQVIRSRDLAYRVIDALSLEQNPEFNPLLRQEESAVADSWSARLGDWLGQMAGQDGDAQDAAGAPQAVANAQRTAVANTLLDKLEVRPLTDTWVIQISLSSKDPQTAARVVNKVAALYLEFQLKSKVKATEAATRWLTDHIADLRQQVTEAERAGEGFRAQSGLIEGKEKGTTLAAQKTSEITSQLIQAQANRVAIQAQLHRVQDLLRTGGVDSAIEVLNSPMIQRLKGQWAEIRQQVVQHSTKYGERYPDLISLQAALADIQNNIKIEVDKIVQGLKNQAAVAQARVTALQASLDQMTERMAALNENAVKLRALEREAEASRALLEDFLGRAKETRLQQSIQQSDARIISHAEVPLYPSFPNKRLLLGLAGLLSGLLGLFLAFIAEALDGGLRSTDQIEERLGLPALGLVPALTGFRRRRPPEHFVLEQPASALTEGVRNLHTSLMLSAHEAPSKVVLVTSALPREGKTSITLSLGRVRAVGGNEVVVVDCDLRSASVHHRLSGARAPGLVDYLTGKADLADILQRDEQSGLHFIAAGLPVASPADVLASERMSLLLQQLVAQYDLVLLDSPPVLAAADARILARVADRTVFVVRWAEASQERVIKALRRLMEADGEIAGVLLNRVNVRKHARYRYGDSGDYTGAFAKYYVSNLGKPRWAGDEAVEGNRAE